MKSFTDALRAMGQTMKNVFRPPETVHFPQEKRERAERFRTSFALLHDDGGDEACIGCLACERICPSQVITVGKASKKESPVTGKKRAYATDFGLDLNACIFCELCIQVCPADAIVMLRVHDEPQYSREGLYLTMEKLYENEKKEQSWGTGKKLMAMQDPKRGQPKPEKKKVAPKAAPKTDEPKAEAPKAEAPKPDEPKAAPKTDEPKAAPKTDEPKTDEPKAETAKTDAPKVEPKTDEPTAETAKADEPKDGADESSSTKTEAG